MVWGPVVWVKLHRRNIQPVRDLSNVEIVFCGYRILSKNSSPIVPIIFCHLVVIRIGNKMAEGDEYLDYHNKTLLEWTAKSWGSLLVVFLGEMADFELTVGKAIRG